MKSTTKNILTDLITRYDALKACYPAICVTIELLRTSYKNGNKLLVCGNGGSASDAEHIVGELMKSFLLPRRLQPALQQQIQQLFPESAAYLIANLQQAVPAISLVSQTSLMTAYANDNAADLAFAQQVLGYGNQDDVLLAISTSGNSKNVIYAAQIAKCKGMKVIVLTGASGGRLKELADVLINVPSEYVAAIQEYHLPIYHAVCACLENELFAEEDI